jgi:N-acetylglucosamine-6-sulfatase
LRRSVGTALLAVTLLGVAATPVGRIPVSHAASQPNIVVILTDDQRWDELENMPNVHALLAQQGVQFTNTFEPNSLCCPSRTTILSGQFSNHSGVWNNTAPNGGFQAFIPHENQTIAVWLHNAGYRTALIGKYLNQFTVKAAKTTANPTRLLARPGWDYWTSFINPGHSDAGEPPAYYDYQLDLGATQSVPGTLTMFGDPAAPTPACTTFGTCYSTTVFGQQATSFINATPTSKPFFLYLAPYGPHTPFTPAPQDANALPNCTSGETPPGCYQPMTLSPAGQCPPQQGLPPFCSENVDQAGANEVSWVKALPDVGTSFNTVDRKLQEQTLLEVDRQVGNVVNAVTARGQLSNTVFIFTSDNSLSGGSHRWLPKETPWDEAGHDPFIIRFDPLTSALAGTVDTHFILNADISPTLLALAGVPNPSGYSFDGQVLPTFNPSFSRTAFPLEHLANGTDPPTYCGLRTTPGYHNAGVSGAWKYVRYQNLPDTGYPAFEEELYHLGVDPFEMTNLAGVPGDAATLATLRVDARALCSPPPPGYTWPSAPLPSITSFTPTSGPVGQSVSITGANFTGASSVTFNGTKQSSFTVNSDLSITAAVPSGAGGTGPICVTNAAGSGCSAAVFQVTGGGISRVKQIGTATTTSTSSPTQLSVTVGAGGVPAGDTVVLGVATVGIPSISATDSTGTNVYHLDVSRPYAGTGPCTSAIVRSKLTSPLSQGQTITVRLVGKANAWGFAADAWAGLSGAVDATGRADSASVASKAPSVTSGASTTQPREAVIAVACTTANPTISAGSGYAPSAMLRMVGTMNKHDLGDEFKTVSVAGSQTATFTLNSAQNWSAVIATYP